MAETWQKEVTVSMKMIKTRSSNFDSFRDFERNAAWQPDCLIPKPDRFEIVEQPKS